MVKHMNLLSETLWVLKVEVESSGGGTPKDRET